MTSKERVLAAINHVQPDRVPVDYLGTPEIDRALLRHFRTSEWECVLEALGVDLRTVGPRYVGPPLPPGQDIWGVIRKPVQNIAGTYDEPANYPWRHFTSIEEVDAYPWPSVDWFDFSTIRDQCRQYSEYAIVFGGMGVMDLINGTAFGRGVEQTLMDIATTDPVGMALMQHRFTFYQEYACRALREAKGLVDIFFVGDDYGSQRGLLMSPSTWRRLFRNRLKAMVDLGHEFGCKVMLHSCGSTREIMPDLIELGLDIYETVQPEAAGMDPEELKAAYGDKLAFHGTVSTQTILPFGTPSEVQAYVRRRIDVVGKDGGLILAPAHNIQPDTPLENVLAMYSTVRADT